MENNLINTLYNEDALIKVIEDATKRLDALRLLKTPAVWESKTNDKVANVLPETKSKEAKEKIPYENAIKNIPKEYNPNLSQILKVCYLLNKRGENGGFVTDLVKDILSLEKDLKEAKAKKFITHHLSRLYNFNLINKETIGIKYRYFI